MSPPIAGTIYEWVILQRNIRFFVANPGDVIQRHHAKGEFYEAEELHLIRKFFRQPGGTFVDIGTNVGNHTLFVAKYLAPRKVIVFEPGGIAAEILKVNIALNALAALVDLSYLGLALSDGVGSGVLNTPHKDNLGGSRITAQSGGDVVFLPGDALLANQEVDFIKIDVEGMEMRVLHGLTQTIRRDRPRLFVEVDNQNAGAFVQWVATEGYQIAERFRRYPVNENYLCIPI
jgi:FkbM family methyltransferase